MFFDTRFLIEKGPWSNLWMAAHWEKRLTKTVIVQTDLGSSLDMLVSGNHPSMALRLSGQLLLGATKIYGRKARYLLEDCAEALVKLREAFQAAADAVNLSSEAVRASHAAITLPKPKKLLNDNDLEDLLPSEPELDLEALLNNVAPLSQTANQQLGATLFGSPQKYSMILSANRSNNLIDDVGIDFNSDLEVETGRRASTTDLTDYSIESGRRASESPMLPFSPLRVSSPMKNIEMMRSSGEYIADDFVDNDSLGQVFGIDPASEVGVQRESLEPLVTQQIATVVRRRKNASSRRSQKRKALVKIAMDSQTEIDPNTFQRNLSDSATITLHNDCNAITEDFTMMMMLETQESRVDSNTDRFNVGASALDLAHSEIENEPYDSVPIYDEDMATVNEDEIPSSSPKAPRLLSSLRSSIHGMIVPDLYADSKYENNEENHTGHPELNSTIISSVHVNSEAALASWNLSKDSKSSGTPLINIVNPRESNRRLAAEAFMHILILGSKGRISVTQSSPYEPILLSAVA